MSDDSGGEKTHEATPKKLQDQREKGQIAQSEDIPKLLILLALSELTLDLSTSGLQRLEQIVLAPMGQLEQPFIRAMQSVALNTFSIMAYFLLVTLAVAIIMRLTGSWLQFGFLFAPEAVKPDINKLNPVTNFKEKFSAKALMTLLLNIIKAIFISLVIYIVLTPAIDILIKLTITDIQQYMDGLISLFRKILYFTFAILIVLSIADMSIQKHAFAKKMRMNLEDLKNESKETQGKPEVKQAQKERAMELMEQPPASNGTVEDADMVIVNPTHVAVALYYRPEETPMPILLGKGGDAQARDMIEQARRHNIPVLQCIRLARAIYSSPVGSHIPRETIRGVAQLYGILRQLEEEFDGDIIEVSDNIFSS